MNRRAFLYALTLSALAAPLAVEAQQAQQAGKVYRIGFLLESDERRPYGRRLGSSPRGYAAMGGTRRSIS
jgi:hypothetical protein